MGSDCQPTVAKMQALLTSSCVLVKNEYVHTSHVMKERLKEVLEATGLNQSEVSRAMGVSRQAVGKWVREGEITRENAAKLADMTGYSLQWILLGRGPKQEEGFLFTTAPPMVVAKKAYEQLTYQQKKDFLASVAKDIAGLDDEK